MKKLFKILLIIFGIFAFVIFVETCKLIILYSPSKVEVIYSLSPDKSTVATVTEIDRQAISSFRYVINVQYKNQIFSFPKEVANLNDAVRNKCAHGVDLEWKSDEVLLIKYLAASNANLKSQNIKLGGRTIRIELVPNTINSSAPCGRMEQRPIK